jgi:O-antigen/teichoic acid export membrane protein
MLIPVPQTFLSAVSQAFLPAAAIYSNNGPKWKLKSFYGIGLL